MGNYRYYLVLQGFYCDCWEDLEEVETNSLYVIKDEKEAVEFKKNIQEYKLAEPEFRHRVIRRPVKQ